MRVGFLLLHPFSFQKTKSLATTVRVRELAVSLSKMGVEAYVLTPYESSHETSEGIKVIGLDNTWFKLGLSDLIYGLSRKVYHTRMFHRAFVQWYLKKMLEKKQKSFFKLIDAVNKCEIDVLQAVQDNAALLLLGVKDKLDLPSAIDLHTIWPEEVVATGVIKRGSREFETLVRMERQILQGMDLITVLGEEMYKYVLSNYQVEKKKVLIVEPGARPLVKEPLEKVPPPKVVYSGIVSYRKNFKLFLDAIPYVISKQTYTSFYATKKGDLVRWALSYIKKRRINNLRWFWFLGSNQLYDFMKKCHVGVITNEKSRANMMDMPSKLFDYMSLGMPVVTNDIGGWTKIVKQYEVGLTTKGSPESFADGIVTLIESPEFAYKCGKNGLKLIRKRFNWEISARKLYQGYSSVKSE